ncbi:MAG: AAA family ATPase [Candidatus Promineifilaceae bacterium]
MTKIYAIAMQKGGVGKTTSVVNMAAFLTNKGFRVLVVDLDPQANATSYLGFDKYKANPSMYDVLLERSTLDRVAIYHDVSKVSLAPSNPAMAGAEVELVNVFAREYRLKNALKQTNSTYDYILIDCPPSLGLLTVNALAAAKDGVIIPIQCEYLALEGLTQLLETIELIRKHVNNELRVRGLIMTMYDRRTNLSRQVVEEVRFHFPDKVFRTIIPRNIRLSEAPSYGMPISLYAPNSPGGIAYKILTAELVGGDRAQPMNRKSIT